MANLPRDPKNLVAEDFDRISAENRELKTRLDQLEQVVERLRSRLEDTTCDTSVHIVSQSMLGNGCRLFSRFPAGFCKHPNGLVFLRGRLMFPSSAATADWYRVEHQAFVLPEGFRPQYTHLFVCSSTAGPDYIFADRVSVHPNGVVTIRQNPHFQGLSRSESDWIALDSVSFVAEN